MDKFEANIVKVSPLPEKQLTDLYGPELSSRMAHKGFAFRAMHTHGRALFGMIPRLAGPDHETDYVLMDGELVAGVTLGWNFGDGHLHDEGLLAALHARCGFEPGEVRVMALESQPFGQPRQAYRLIDGATGVFEEGLVEVADMLERQPWDVDFPVRVTSARTAGAVP